MSARGPVLAYNLNCFISFNFHNNPRMKISKGKKLWLIFLEVTQRRKDESSAGLVSCSVILQSISSKPSPSHITAVLLTHPAVSHLCTHWVFLPGILLSEILLSESYFTFCQALQGITVLVNIFEACRLNALCLVPTLNTMLLCFTCLQILPFLQAVGSSVARYTGLPNKGIWTELKLMCTVFIAPGKNKPACKETNTLFSCDLGNSF